MSEKRPKVRSDVFPRRQSNWSLLWKIYHFSPLLCSFCMKCSLGISNFLESSLVFFSSVVFLSLHCSLRKDFLSLLALLLNSAFRWVYLSFSHLPFASLLFSAICKFPQTTTLPFCESFSWVSIYSQ